MNENFYFQNGEVTFKDYVEYVLMVMNNEIDVEKFDEELCKDIKNTITILGMFNGFVKENNIDLDNIKRKDLIDFILMTFREVSVSDLIIACYTLITTLEKNKKVNYATATELQYAVDTICKLLMIYIEDSEDEIKGGIS